MSGCLNLEVKEGVSRFHLRHLQSDLHCNRSQRLLELELHRSHNLKIVLRERRLR